MHKKNQTFPYYLFFCIGVFFYCEPKKNNPYSQLNKTHKVSSLENSNLASTNWEERVLNLTTEYADYIYKLNQIDQIPNVPIPLQAQEFEFFLKEFKKISRNELKIARKVKNKYIHWIVLCKNLGSTGLSGIIQKEGELLGGFIFLDVELLRNANDWISYKENTVFKLGYTLLEIQIENSTENLLHNAIDYIIFHELGHIVSVIEGFVPAFDLEFRDFQKTSFTKLDWLEETRSIHDFKIPKREQVKFYSKPTLRDEDVIPIYTALEKTPFPTLYSATNADDHFAESFVSYAHVFVKNKPWILKVVKDKNVVYEMENGIIKDRCKREREFMERFFQNFY